MNPFSAAVLIGLLFDAGLVAIVAIRGRRLWVQATYAACAFAFTVAGAAAVGTEEGLLPPTRDDIVLGTMLLSYALTTILVLSLIHGETLPRRRATAFLLLVPVPLLAFLAPSQGWTTAIAYDDSALGGFLVLCLGIALAETLYARWTSPLFAASSFWLGLGVIALIVAGPVYTYELEFLRAPVFAGANAASPIALAGFAIVALQADPFPTSPRIRRGRSLPGALRAGEAIVFDEARPKYAVRAAHEEAVRGRTTLVLGRDPPPITASGASYA